MIKSNKNNVKILDRIRDMSNVARTGISLHCHTLHSRELLDFVPYYAERIPVVSGLWRRKLARAEAFGERLPDFKRGYWAPPLTGDQVVESESDSLVRMGLETIVSITDHDSIDANLELNRELPNEISPISMEWTVPFGDAFFHVGVHNLPENRAEEIRDHLLAYTFSSGYPNGRRLRELFSMLNEIPDCLVIFNHPIWDIEMIGQERHERAMHRFLAEHGGSIHALEINGFRSWAENQEVMELAEAVGLPVVSGGDRHCCSPNTMINVTNAGTFSEFVDEIRIGKQSQVVVTPEYRVPLPSRQLASIKQIVADYPTFPDGRRAWTDRVFLDKGDGDELWTLTESWGGQRPVWTRMAMILLSVMSHPVMRPIIALTIGDSDIGRSSTPTGGKTLVIGDGNLAVERR